MAEPTVVDLELVLAADGSGSIDDEELALQRDGYAAAFAHPEVLRTITGGPGAFAVVADKNLSFAEAVRRKLILEFAMCWSRYLGRLSRPGHRSRQFQRY